MTRSGNLLVINKLDWICLDTPFALNNCNIMQGQEGASDQRFGHAEWAWLVAAPLFHNKLVYIQFVMIEPEATDCFSKNFYVLKWTCLPKIVFKYIFELVSISCMQSACLLVKTACYYQTAINISNVQYPYFKVIL